MENRQPQSQHLVRLEQVPQVRPGKAPAHRTAAGLADGSGIRLVLLVHDVHGALPGKELPVAAVAGGHDAVKKVHTPAHGLDDVAGCPHPHQIPGLLLRHKGFHNINHLIHDLRRFPHRQTADGEAVTVNLRDLAHMPGPEVRKGCALVDAKEHLLRVHRVRQSIQPVMLRLAPLQPAECSLTTLLCVVIWGRIFYAFVKGHGNVAAEV